jgi:dethiobiotin synthetase
VVRLAAPAAALTLANYPDPLAPTAAARVAQLPMLPMTDAVHAVRELGHVHDLVLIEGAGGLLVPMGHADWTVLELAIALEAPVVVVARAGLGTLNHTALTRAVLAEHAVNGYVVVGAWPTQPELVHHANLLDLPPLSGMLPDGAGGLDGATFRAHAANWLTPLLHGRTDGDDLPAAATLPAHAGG